MIQDNMLWDVVEVAIKGGKVLAFIAEGKTINNATAIVSMAVMRRGVKKSFFAEVPAGSLKVGEDYRQSNYRVAAASHSRE